MDTGSPKCIFGRAIADSLYIDLDVFNSRPLSILGKTVNATTANVTLSFDPFFCKEWVVEAAFMHADFALSYVGVLGTEGFFDRWVTSFNYYDGYFVVEEHPGTLLRALKADDPNLVMEKYDDSWERPTVY